MLEGSSMCRLQRKQDGSFNQVKKRNRPPVVLYNAALLQTCVNNPEFREETPRTKKLTQANVSFSVLMLLSYL